MTDRDLTGPHGPIPVRIYPARGDTAGFAPGLVWLHGGGFAYGDLDMPEGDWVARQLAGRGIGVVSVAYRLAPQLAFEDDGALGEDGAHFPVPSDDVLAAFTWTVDHAAELGLNPESISLGGASAGAALAAGASLRLRDAGQHTPAQVLLAYPTVHAALPEPSPELAAKLRNLPEDRLFRPEAVARMNLNYVQDPAALANPHAFPGGHDLTGLPPTLILNSERDSLRSSGEAYADELDTAGVHVTCLFEPDTTHGHLNQPDSPAALASIATMADWLLSPLDSTLQSHVPSSIKEAS
ncbi:alpha/beta hydrolase fold domain-containing protein [Cryobacterium sp.]|jgi:acetyl esterase|uniref:alpha/beta hydrolase fold domain-containing protein n=1 Tax=Cryobacterium sp. TaxID=1926290 RepID=UPI00261DBB89|nr:alpha/beta hydrolase fold domain-containing protein [Cryobacterium sp.]MCU1446544.1 alpha/beta hydrolase [Cryobacterium sp.]